MIIRRFCKKAEDEFYIDMVKKMYINNVTGLVVKMISNGTVVLDDINLLDTYINNHTNAIKDFEISKSAFTNKVSKLFQNHYCKWEHNGFRFSVVVDVYDCTGDELFEDALNDGFIEHDLDDQPSYKSQFLKFEDIMTNAFPEEFVSYDSIIPRPISVTMQLTEDCNLCCTYCYQTNKTKKKMSIETAKQFIDMILEESCDYINYKKNPAVVLEFMGGEGLLEISLIDDILSHTLNKMANMNHPWLYRWNSFIGTNGVLYRDPTVQKVLTKWKEVLSLAITLDGYKELHDKCRIFPNGAGSYDYAEDAIKDQISRGVGPNTKLTISPENLEMIPGAVKNFVRLGLIHIWMNCIYEEEWTTDQAATYYNKLKEIADYIIDSDLEDTIDFSLFNTKNYKPVHPDELENWCGGDGSMLAINPDGEMYNCVRYMESSLDGKQKPLRIGDLSNGIGTLPTDKQNISCMTCINRRSQSSDECFNCEIADGCGWCSAFNYQCFGTPNKRSTNICNMHKAQALANTYYWNRYNCKHHIEVLYPINIALDKVISIVSEREYDVIKGIKEDK